MIPGYVRTSAPLKQLRCNIVNNLNSDTWVDAEQCTYGVRNELRNMYAMYCNGFFYQFTLKKIPEAISSSMQGIAKQMDTSQCEHSHK